MAFKWGEPGTSPTQALTLFTSSTGTVTSDGSVLIAGERSVKCDSGAGNATAFVQKNGIMPTSGWISIRFILASIPTSSAVIFDTQDASANAVFRIQVLTSGIMRLLGVTTVISTGVTPLKAGIEYQLVLAYTITSATVNESRVFINQSYRAELSASNATLTTAGIDRFRAGFSVAPGANIVMNHGQINVGDDATLTNPGDVRCTAKLADTANTQDAAWGNIGSGLVNERPIDIANGRSIASDSGTGQETYDVQARDVGDVNLNGKSILGYYGWVHGAKGAGAGSPVDKIVLGGLADTTFAPTTTAATFETTPVTDGSYPSTIGWNRTTGALPDALFYECGVVVAYLEPWKGGSPADDRYRYRPSVLWSGTSTLGTKRSAWPDNAVNPGDDAFQDSVTRIF